MKWNEQKKAEMAKWQLPLGTSRVKMTSRSNNLLIWDVDDDDFWVGRFGSQKIMKNTFF